MRGRAVRQPGRAARRARSVRGVGEQHAGSVHRGATSQDIVDTAAMLVAQRAARLVDAELAGAADECARLADEHRRHRDGGAHAAAAGGADDVRLKAAGWLVGLVEARARLAAVAASLPAQLGGAAGTLAALGDRRRRGAAALRRGARPARAGRCRGTRSGRRSPSSRARSPARRARRRRSPATSCCSRRPRWARWPSASRAGPRRCRTSAIPSAPCSPSPASGTPARTPRSSLESVVQEHERAAGAWQAEWHALATALAATGGAVGCGAAVAHRPRGGRRADAREHRRRTRSPRRRASASPCAAARRLPRLGRRVRRPCARAAPRMSGTVVLCGSLGSVASIWDPQLPALDGRRVVRIDHPGHGGAPLAESADVGDLASARSRAATGDEHVLVRRPVARRSGRDAVGADRARARRAARARVHGRALRRARAVARASRARPRRRAWPRSPTPCSRGGSRRRSRTSARTATCCSPTDPEGYARCCDALARWDVRDALGREFAPRRS